MPRAVRLRMEAAPIPINPVREPGRIAGTWHPLAYLTGLRFYSDSRRKQRLEVIGPWSSSEVVLRDPSTQLCRFATATWVRTMVDKYGLDEHDQPLGRVDWERLVHPHTITLARPVAEEVLEEAERQEERARELRALMQAETPQARFGLRSRHLATGQGAA